MAMGSPDWIEESLARLETMEQERDEHEKALENTTNADALRRHSESIDRLDEEIKRLYAALEAVAGEDDVAEEEEDVDEVIRTHPFGREPEATAPRAPASVALVPDEPEDDPFGVPSPAPSVPGVAAAGFSVPASTTPDLGYDAGARGGGGLKWVVALVLLVGGGGGGYVLLNGNKAPPAPPPTPAGAKVIDATAVPDDTQGPRGAQGRDGVTRTPEREYTGGRRSAAGRPNGASGPAKKSGGGGKTIQLKSSGDPLG